MNLEQREMENVYLYKMTKIFFLICFVIYYTMFLKPGLVTYLANFLCIAVFDVFFLSYAYSSAKIGRQGFYKGLCMFFAAMGIFIVFQYFILGIHIKYAVIYMIFFHHIVLFFISLTVCILGFLNGRNKNMTATLVLIISIVIGIVATVCIIIFILKTLFYSPDFIAFFNELLGRRN